MSSMFKWPCRRQPSGDAKAKFSPTFPGIGLLSLSAVVLTAAAACHSPDPAVQKADAIRQGDALVQQRQYAQAVSEYQDAVKIDPRDGGLRFKLAAAHRLANQWSEAAREALAAADLQPDNREAQLQAVAALIGLTRFIDAADRVAPLVQNQPDDANALVLSANANARLVTVTWALVKLDEAMRLGQGVEAARSRLRTDASLSGDRRAEDSFRRALQIAPKMPEARLGFASFLWAAGRLDEGAELLKQAADDDPGSPLLSRALGLFYASRGLDAEAEKYLKVSASTGDRDSQLALADYYGQRNRSEETLPMLVKLAGGDDPDGGAAVRAADAELRLGRSDQAKQRAELVLARYPLNTRAMRIKAQAMLAANDLGQAVTAARAAVAADPRSRDARIVLARSLAATGDSEHAFDEFAEASRLSGNDGAMAKEMVDLAFSLGRDQVALAYAREAVRLNPNDRGASMALATAQIRTGDFQGADRTIAPLVAKRPAPPDALVLLAMIQAARGNSGAARSTYLEALEADRNSLDALSGLLELEIQDNQAARVQPRVEQAVAAHPNDPRYLMLAARTSRAAGDAKRAESILRNVLDIDANHTEAGLLLADILAQQARREEAIQLIRRLLTSKPSSFQLRFSLARLLEETGHIPEARTQYEELVAANENAIDVSARLAALYANQRTNMEQALKLAKMAKERSPNDPLFGDTLGWVYVRSGLPSRGQPLLADAVRARPATALFRYHLGIAHQLQGDFAAAREELRRALTLDPGFIGAADARATLDTLTKSP